MDIVEQVVAELDSLKACGVPVKKACYSHIAQNQDEIEEYHNEEGMSISDIADLIRDIC